MPVLIDGNNLLYAAQSVDEAGKSMGRSMLCGILGDWARRTGQRIHVVFDGPSPSAQVAAQLGDPDVRISYSGVGVKADTMLERVLNEDSAARRVLVVSSDRAVQRASRRRQAKTIAADLFWVGVKNDLARPNPVRIEPREKRTGLDGDAAQEWLKTFGLE